MHGYALIDARHFVDKRQREAEDDAGKKSSSGNL
jgi:hypothetical protein